MKRSCVILKIKKYDGAMVEICLDSNKIKMHEGNFGTCSDVDYIPITTDNVTISNLDFDGR